MHSGSSLHPRQCISFPTWPSAMEKDNTIPEDLHVQGFHSHRERFWQKIVPAIWFSFVPPPTSNFLESFLLVLFPLYLCVCLLSWMLEIGHSFSTSFSVIHPLVSLSMAKDPSAHSPASWGFFICLQSCAIPFPLILTYNVEVRLDNHNH